MRLAVLLLALLLAAPAWGQAPRGVVVPDSSALAARAEQLFVRGLTRAHLNDYDGARVLFEQVLAVRPREAAVLGALAEVHEALGDATAARYYAEEAIAATPAEPEGYRQLAALQLQTGDPAAAAATLARLAELAPRDADALSQLARIQQQVGEFAEALATYARLLDVIGESGAVRTRMLGLHLRLDDVAGAAEAAEALVRLAPENPALHRQLADLQLRLGRADDARATLEAGLTLHPGHPDLALPLADVLREGGDEAGAEGVLAGLGGSATDPEAVLGRALGLYARAATDPAAAEAARDLLEGLDARGELPAQGALLLGDLRFGAGDYAGAAAMLGPALAEEPGFPEAWARLAAAHLESGDARAAAEAADEGLLLFPGQYALLRVALVAHTETGDHERALRFGEEALEVLAEEAPEATAERSAVLATVGLLHARRGDGPAADAAYAEALALDPENATALNNLAYGLATRGERLDEALGMARRATELVADHPSFLDTLGWVHYARGEYDEAARWLTRAAEAAERTGRPSAVILEHLGDAEAARGRTQDAVRHWRAALEADPSRTHLESKIERAR